MLPVFAATPPTGLDWLHEVEFDGLRIQIHIAPFNFATSTTVGSSARVPTRVIKIYSKGGDDVTNRFGRLLPDLAKLPVQHAIIDAQVVACDPAHMPFFASPMGADGPNAPLCLWCFDLLAVNGMTITALMLRDRKKLLAAILEGGAASNVQLSDTFLNSDRLLEGCRTMCFKGIISKRKESLYVSGPSGDWLKVTTAEWCAASARSETIAKTGEEHPRLRLDKAICPVS